MLLIGLKIVNNETISETEYILIIKINVNQILTKLLIKLWLKSFRQCLVGPLFQKNSQRINQLAHF